jgi:hypothetical protein
MRPLMVELLTEAIEALLLSAAVGRWGPCGFGFQGTVHTFMTAMLLRFTRLETFREDTESDPLG